MKNIIFDIETLTSNPLEQEAQVVCIGVICGKHKQILMSTKEKNLLKKFWDLPFFEGHFRLIGFNSFSFDIPYLLVRSFKYGIKIPDIRNKSIDLRLILSYGNKFKNGKLTDYATLILGGRGKKKYYLGENINSLWDKGKYEELKKYCEQDIFLTFKIFERLEQMEVL